MIALIKCILLFAVMTSGMKEKEESQLGMINLNVLLTENENTNELHAEDENTDKLTTRNNEVQELCTQKDKSVELITQVKTESIQLLHVLLLDTIFDRLFDFVWGKEIRALATINKRSMKFINKWLQNSNLKHREFKKIFRSVLNEKCHRGSVISHFKYIDEKNKPWNKPTTIQQPIGILEEEGYEKEYDSITTCEFCDDFRLQLSPLFHEIDILQQSSCKPVGFEYKSITLKSQNNGYFKVTYATWKITGCDHRYESPIFQHQRVAYEDFEINLEQNKMQFKREANYFTVKDDVRIDSPTEMRIKVKPVFNNQEKLIEFVETCFSGYLYPCK